MWEYVKGSEADFEGAPEWATLRVSFLAPSTQNDGWFIEGGFDGSRWEFTDGRSKHYALSKCLSGGAFEHLKHRVIAERRKVDNLQTRVNDANLEQLFDTVQRPAHYNQSGIECIDAIAASMTAEEFRGFLKGNVQKYVWRSEHKGGAQDYHKAQYYLNRLVKELSK